MFILQPAIRPQYYENPFESRQSGLRSSWTDPTIRPAPDEGKFRRKVQKIVRVLHELQDLFMGAYGMQISSST